MEKLLSGTELLGLENAGKGEFLTKSPLAVNLGRVLSGSQLSQGGWRVTSLWPLLSLGEPDPSCEIINLLVSAGALFVECKSLRMEKSPQKVSDFRGREAMNGRTALGKSPLNPDSSSSPGMEPG